MTTKENTTSKLNGMTKYWKENLQVIGNGKWEDDTLIECQNPYSGAKCWLPPVAYAVYRELLRIELIGRSISTTPTGQAEIKLTGKICGQTPARWNQIFSQGKSWFIENYIEEYMILLD